MQDNSSPATTADMPLDPVKLAQDLIRLPSVTPVADNTMDLLERVLGALGFTVHRMTFEEPGTEPVPNLYARIGTTAPNLCFAGHTDVVPTGKPASWSHDPFGADIVDGQLYGRGAADMKSSIASFIAAASKALRDGTLQGSLSLLITGDEEGPAINGTVKVLQWLKERGEVLDYCLVGEPTNPNHLGEMVKIGRRGSLHGHVTVHGTQGHVAYPHHAHNPIPDLVKLLSTLDFTLDDGNAFFQPSNLEIVKLHVDNDRENVIPAEAFAHFNVRFNTVWTPDTLKAKLAERMDSAGVRYDIHWHVSGDAFLTPEGPLSEAVSRAIALEVGHKPVLSTTGGTSDARFIKDVCPVVEFGLVGQTMHKIDEHVAVSDITTLANIYHHIIEDLAG